MASKKCPIPLATKVNNCVEEGNISSIWKKHLHYSIKHTSDKNSIETFLLNSFLLNSFYNYYIYDKPYCIYDYYEIIFIA